MGKWKTAAMGALGLGVAGSIMMYGAQGKAAIDSPASASQKPNYVNVEVNGVKVDSAANSKINGVVYVDAKKYADLLHASFSYSDQKGAYVLENQTLETKVINGVQTAKLDDIVKILGKDKLGVQKLSYTKGTNTEYILALPKGVIQITPMVAGMGEHWADPADMPHGPIYGVIDDKLVFVEQMIEQSAFVNGTTINNIPGMKGLPSPSVNHTDIQFEEYGHTGFETPHYDIHHYFDSHTDHLLAGPPTIGYEVMSEKTSECMFAYFVGGALVSSNTTDVKNEGHGVVYVDGVPQTKLLDEQIGCYSISGLTAGKHHIKLELQNNTGTQVLGTSEFDVNIQN
ncbi:hypothetical protein [Ectobacillus ponti]|uniref:Uncharacterized protein n=1 Tax=Ectobacillus ponti TaxID=2961894 RepID=A0AA41XDU1_9BACI|nr:hypothetical protein [Ectobacillus ponti]MCP8971078.1 hypothetical protein [Ectobacillus ponti]